MAKVNSVAKRPVLVKHKDSKAKAPLGKKNKHRSQHDLETAILRRCAAGRDQLDKRRVPGVNIVKLPLGATGCPTFPRRWSRTENGKTVIRGNAEWYIPPNADTSRRMLFMHGGSYVLWAPQDAPYRALCTRLALACGVCVLSIDYRMAPEHKYPAAYEDSCAALEWIAMHGPCDPLAESPAKDVFVCGDSAGGALALAVCVAPTASVRAKLRGVVGISAWADLTASTPSYDTRAWDAERCFGDAVNAGTDRKGGRDEAEGYLGRGGVAKYGRDWQASPFFTPTARLRKMPAVLLHVGDYELILDESVLLCERMKKAGHRDATVSVYPRMWHCWHEYTEGGGERQTLRKAEQAIREIGDWVKARHS